MFFVVENGKKHSRSYVFGIICYGDVCTCSDSREQCGQNTIALAEEEMLEVGVVRGVLGGAGHQNEDWF